jgi:diketogulonate reductase-like aldo/keto reductase
MTRHSTLSRRSVLGLMAAGGTAAMLAPDLSSVQAAEPGLRPIPSTGERVPAVGLGTWITFNVGADRTLRDESADVMDAFFKAGGRMIDSSPMYGSAQEVVGYGLRRLGHPQALFSADKVWISSPTAGPGQIEESRRLWDIPRFDLLQVHNLLSWESHLETLFAMKAEGRLRYVGITTSEGRRHGEVERIMASHPLDFVQISYNALDREVERRILPLAQERGIGVIVNRPFRQGSLTRSLEGEALPDWAVEIGAATWAQFLLKFIVSHPAVTCAIPATTQVAHVTENMAASAGPMPDEAMRRRMAAFVEDI